MAVTNGWGQAAVNNTIDYGKGKTTATNNWGQIYDSSASGDTSLGTAAAFSNTKSINLDGVDDYVDTNSTYSQLDGLKIATFSLWVKPASISQQIFLGLAHSTSVMSHLILYASGLLRMTFSSGGYYINANTTAITAGQWNHIMVCFDKNQSSSSLRGRIFVNGVDETASGNLNNVAYPTANTPLRIGAYPTGSNNANAIIDEVAIWAGTDLRNDVSTIYNSGAPNNLNDNGLTAPTTWYRFGDGDTSPNLTDNGSGGDNATMYNVSTFSTDVPT